MDRMLGLALAAALALAGAACEVTEREQTSADSDTMAQQPPVAPAPGEVGYAAGTALGVDTLQGVGAYLTDGEGRALYMLEGEPSDSSTCYDACAEEWPPFLAEAGAPTADAERGTPTADTQGVQERLIGTVQRRDGRSQVTYGGHLLYYYHDDEEPGQTTGHDLTDQWGEWYLVTPEGEHLEEGGA